MENNKPIRVLQMTASLFRGGSQNMIVNLYKAIDRDKIQFDFIVDHPELDDLKVTVESLGAKVYTMPSFKVINIFEVVKAWKSFFKEHPEYKIIHSHSRSYASIYLKIAKQFNLKTIIHSHNTSNGDGIKAKIKNLLQYRLRYIADYFFGCSKNAGLWLFGEEIVNSDKFYIINNAVDADKFKFDNRVREEYRKKFNLDNNKVYIQVGEFNDQKNHNFTIDFFSKVLEKEPSSKLYLVGTGEYFEKIKNRISEEKIENSIILLGRRDDVNNLLCMADVYIMPSIFEGLSLAAIEAQTSGINCLLSDCVSKDVDITNTCKFLPLELDKWIDACLKQDNIRHNNYQKIIDAGYDTKTSAKWLEEFYSKIVK